MGLIKSGGAIFGLGIDKVPSTKHQTPSAWMGLGFWALGPLDSWDFGILSAGGQHACRVKMHEEYLKGL